MSDDESYRSDLPYAVTEWGLTPLEWKRACGLLRNIGVGPERRKAYVDDLLSIIEAGFNDYFSNLCKGEKLGEAGAERSALGKASQRDEIEPFPK